MKRLPDWRVRFKDTIDNIRREAFAWGSSDCLYGLTVPVLKALTGETYFKRYRRYKTAKGALSVMRRAGFDNLADLVASELTEVHPSQVFVGDIVAIPTDDEFGFSLGAVNGERVFVLHQNGLGTRDLLEATRAFQVI